MPGMLVSRSHPASRFESSSISLKCLNLKTAVMKAEAISEARDRRRRHLQSRRRSGHRRLQKRLPLRKFGDIPGAPSALLHPRSRTS